MKKMLLVIFVLFAIVIVCSMNASARFAVSPLADTSLRDVYMRVTTSALDGTELFVVYWDTNSKWRKVNSVPTGTATNKVISRTFSEWRTSGNEWSATAVTLPNVTVYVTGNMDSSLPIKTLEYDGLNHRSLVIAPVGLQSATSAPIVDTHYYVSVNGGKIKYLGRTTLSYFEWAPHGAGLHPDFLSGPQPGSKYQFVVFGLTGAGVVGGFYASNETQFSAPDFAVQYIGGVLAVQLNQKTGFNSAAEQYGDTIRDYHIYLRKAGETRAVYVGRTGNITDSEFRIPGSSYVSSAFRNGVPVGEYEIFVYGIGNNKAYESMHRSINIIKPPAHPTPTNTPTFTPTFTPTKTPTKTPAQVNFSVAVTSDIISLDNLKGVFYDGQLDKELVVRFANNVADEVEIRVSENNGGFKPLKKNLASKEPFYFVWRSGVQTEPGFENGPMFGKNYRFYIVFSQNGKSLSGIATDEIQYRLLDPSWTPTPTPTSPPTNTPVPTVTPTPTNTPTNTPTATATPIVIWEKPTLWLERIGAIPINFPAPATRTISLSKNETELFVFKAEDVGFNGDTMVQVEGDAVIIQKKTVVGLPGLASAQFVVNATVAGVYNLKFKAYNNTFTSKEWAIIVWVDYTPPTATPTNTPLPSTPTPTPTVTNTPRPTNTLVPLVTFTPTPTPTVTPTPTNTPMPTATPTVTPVPLVPTNTPTVVPTGGEVLVIEGENFAVLNPIKYFEDWAVIPPTNNRKAVLVGNDWKVLLSGSVKDNNFYFSLASLPVGTHKVLVAIQEGDELVGSFDWLIKEKLPEGDQAFCDENKFIVIKIFELRKVTLGN